MATRGRLATLPEVLYHYRYHLENSSLKRVSPSFQTRSTALSNDSLYSEGAMRLWAGQPPGILEEFRAENFAWNSDGLKTAILARWGNASPASLRAFVRTGVRLRDGLASLWVKDGLAYDWRCGE
jgi:hypothetical protein